MLCYLFDCGYEGDGLIFLQFVFCIKVKLVYVVKEEGMYIVGCGVVNWGCVIVVVVEVLFEIIVDGIVGICDVYRIEEREVSGMLKDIGEGGYVQLFVWENLFDQVIVLVVEVYFVCLGFIKVYDWV